jgi:hypothetical protein
VGGKNYKKREDVHADAGAGASTAEEQEEIELDKLAIGQVKPQITQKVVTRNNKRAIKQEAKKKEEIQKKGEVKKNGVWDIPWKKDSAVGEIRKPGWFFSGEDVLKER